MKRCSFILIAVFIGMVIANCTVVASDVIRIGVAGAHSGDLASYGLPTLHAVRLVVEEINAKGGILGKKIDIVEADDACKPEVATNGAQKLVSEKVAAIIGHICSGATKSALGIYKDAKIIIISPSATNVDLTKSGDYPNFFRTISPDDAQARLEVEFAITQLKIPTFAVIHDKGDYGKGLAEFARAFLEKAGAKVALFEGVTPGAVDYSAVVQKIKQSNVEGVIYGGYHPEAAKIVMTLRKKQIKIPFISDDGVKDDTFIKVAGKYADGVFASGPIDTTRSPMAIAAIALHKKKFNSDPGAFYLNAHAAIRALLNAIEKAGGTEQDALAKALRQEWVETPLGKISFDERGDAKGIGFAMYVVNDGKYELAK
jgi:branched-chain amino acid transport system substrate-binding protein